MEACTPPIQNHENSSGLEANHTLKLRSSPSSNPETADYPIPGNSILLSEGYPAQENRADTVDSGNDSGTLLDHHDPGTLHMSTGSGSMPLYIHDSNRPHHELEPSNHVSRMPGLAVNYLTIPHNELEVFNHVGPMPSPGTVNLQPIGAGAEASPLIGRREAGNRTNPGIRVISDNDNSGSVAHVDGHFGGDAGLASSPVTCAALQPQQPKDFGAYAPPLIQGVIDGPSPKTDFTPRLDAAAVEEHSKRVAQFWPHTTPRANEQFPDFCHLYQRIKSYNLPNALGAKITLSSGLNLERWEHHLRDYYDKEVCAYLRFGWPLGFSGNKPPVSVDHNHPSGDNYEKHVQQFIQTELAHKAIVGPFKGEPFQPWMRISPIMSRPKKDSLQRRIIIDLTFPENEGVNSGINIHAVLGRDISYTLPNIWDLTASLKALGYNAWIWKADLQRAYRQLRIDPLDSPFLGLQLKKDVFVDLCPSFGCRSSSAACQRTSNAVNFLIRRQGHTVYAYLDDFAGCESTKQQAENAYLFFNNLLQDLGLQLALDKCQAPTQRITWLGYLVDTTSMIISVPPQKVEEIRDECATWLNRSKVSKRMLQSFLGKLLHVAPCIRHARKFTTRLLSTLRNIGRQNWTTLTKDCKADILWFHKYASRANGVTLFADVHDYVIFECDACLSGAGGNSSTHYYSWCYSEEHRRRYNTIHQLEALNILVALKTLAPYARLNNRAVLIYTDNISASFALTSGKTKDPVLGACAREIWLEGAVRDIDIHIVHKHGVDIPLADALSRAAAEPDKKAYAQAEVERRGLSQVPPNINGYQFFSPDL